MRDFYRHVPREQRPKIFGMTASPTWRTTNPEQSITALEQNMDAKVITVMHHAIELENHAPKPTEVSLLFRSIFLLIKMGFLPL